MTQLPYHPGIKEEAFRQQIRSLARMYGWRIQYHTYDSRRSDPGFPDEVFINETRSRILFIEVKAQKGRLSEAQKTWLTALHQCGLEVAVWRPSDMDTIIETLGPSQAKAQLPEDIISR